MVKAWTRTEETKLRRLYPHKSQRECAVIFGRSAKAIASRAKLLRIKRIRPNYRKWVKSEEKLLRAQYPDVLTWKIAKRLRRPVFVIYQHAAKLGLQKSPAYIAAKKKAEAERLQASGVAHRYPKGHVPANKGTCRPGWAPGRMASTQFKKGQAPRNTMPLWSFRWVDGYLMLKTGAPTPKPTAGWEYVHKLIWERWNGPLPHWRVARLWWKDGNHGNCSLSNLELVSAQEHMARTTVHNLPKPLQTVIQLTGALKRKIRRLEEKQNANTEHTRGSSQSSIRTA